jgi:hypothetical protein
VSRKRCLVGLVGANIQHSLSPALHEDAFAASGIVGHYHLMDLDLLGARAGLAELVDCVRKTGFAGINVTHPCKEKVLPLLDGVAAEAAAIGAVNTVVIDRAGGTRGHNTDAAGFAHAFEEALGRGARTDHVVRQKPALGDDRQCVLVAVGEAFALGREAVMTEPFEQVAVVQLDRGLGAAGIVDQACLEPGDVEVDPRVDPDPDGVAVDVEQSLRGDPRLGQPLAHEP